MLSIISFLLAIMILVFVHEFGHYYVAKSFGVKVEEFSIGFGKGLYSKIDKNGVKWKICCIPLGGFVKMYGDSNPASTAFKVAQEPDKAFYTKPLYARFSIVAAGPLANYLLAIIILTGFYFTFGKAEIPPIIHEVVQNSPAEKAGLLKGDKIVAADGKKISDFSDLQKIIMLKPNQSVDLVIDRNGEFISQPIMPIERVQKKGEPMMKAGFIGIAADNQPLYKSFGVFSSGYQALIDVVDISNLTLKALGQILLGTRSIQEIHGPFVIAKESGKSLSHGILDFVLFVAMLSINLGLFNLLPIPILDGGHLALMIYEGIAGRPLTIQVQNVLTKVCMAIIIFLIVISTSNDIKAIIF